MNNLDRNPLLFRKVQQGFLLLTQHYLSGEVNNSLQEASGLRGCLEAVFYFRQEGVRLSAPGLLSHCVQIFGEVSKQMKYKVLRKTELEENGFHRRVMVYRYKVSVVFLYCV